MTEKHSEKCTHSHIRWRSWLQVKNLEFSGLIVGNDKDFT